MKIPLKAIGIGLIGVSAFILVTSLVVGGVFLAFDMYSDNIIAAYAFSIIDVTVGLAVLATFATGLAYIYDDIPEFMDKGIWTTNIIIGSLAFGLLLASFVALWVNTLVNDGNLILAAIGAAGIIGFAGLSAMAMNWLVENVRTTKTTE